ncbi:MAG: NAD(+) diphosphatase [Gemmatimonadota bacterium]|uniref:NAD(+) diphosphatase n=1 Tax=Candidatus Palauibacter scopulicola TaxID=3056741 RepID=UPI0023A39C2C|nr:NAD(+) diphosphatase [Candidatus Palauibacter scopulicola]MDE2661720.1 NAD(+) diphosphatase [Candidatus Palauibacter scopulicola]
MAGEGHRKPNPFAGGGLDRATHLRADPRWLTDRLSDPASRVVPVWRERSLVSQTAREVAAKADGLAYRPVLLPPELAASASAPPEEWIFLGLEGGRDGGRALFAADVSGEAGEAGEAGGAGEGPPTDGSLDGAGKFLDLRGVGAMLGQGDGSLLAYARAIVTWSRRHRFCGSCGAPTRPEQGGHVRRCADEACGVDHFPRTDPAIIVLVTDGDRCLLGRKDIWPEGVYSTLAGFVEPGESLSEAVVREVREESGIEVASVRYRSSQPWPFPASLMLGFRAERVGGELTVARQELVDARWFERADFARRREIGLRLPGRVSISRRLIEDWLAGAPESHYQ